MESIVLLYVTRICWHSLTAGAQTTSYGLLAMSVYGPGRHRSAQVAPATLLMLLAALQTTGFWLADKAPYQQKVAASMTELVHCTQPAVAPLFIRAFFMIIQQSWLALDKHRVDKYLSLIRHMLRQAMLWAVHEDLDSEAGAARAQAFCEVMHSGVLAAKPDGVRYQLADVWLDEMVNVLADGRSHEHVMTLLLPIFQLCCQCDSAILFQRVVAKVLQPLLYTVHPPDDEDASRVHMLMESTVPPAAHRMIRAAAAAAEAGDSDVYLPLPLSAVQCIPLGKQLQAIAGAKTTTGRHRKSLYSLARQLMTAGLERGEALEEEEQEPAQPAAPAPAPAPAPAAAAAKAEPKGKAAKRAKAARARAGSADMDADVMDEMAAAVAAFRGDGGSAAAVASQSLAAADAVARGSGSLDAEAGAAQGKAGRKRRARAAADAAAAVASQDGSDSGSQDATPASARTKRVRVNLSENQSISFKRSVKLLHSSKTNGADDLADPRKVKPAIKSSSPSASPASEDDTPRKPAKRVPASGAQLHLAGAGKPAGKKGGKKGRAGGKQASRRR